MLFSKPISGTNLTEKAKPLCWSRMVQEYLFSWSSTAKNYDLLTYPKQFPDRKIATGSKDVKPRFTSMRRKTGYTWLYSIMAFFMFEAPNCWPVHWGPIKPGLKKKHPGGSSCSWPVPFTATDSNMKLHEMTWNYMKRSVRGVSTNFVILITLQLQTPSETQLFFWALNPSTVFFWL